MESPAAGEGHVAATPAGAIGEIWGNLHQLKAGAKTARATGAWIAAAHDMEPLLRAALPSRTGTASPARHMQQGAT